MARISGRDTCERIIKYLLRAQSKEPDAHLRDDYHMARMIVAKAAQGEKHPFRDACLEYLGLMPDKVWPAIVARRKAQLGNCYALFYDENDLRRRGDLENFLSSGLPKKKPSGSVRKTGKEKLALVAGLEDSLKTRSAEDWLDPRRLKVVEKPPKMASTARAYLNSDASSSAKSRGFSRADLETLFEECDLPRHLVNFITGAWRASGKPSGAEVYFFATVEGYRIEGRYRSERTVRYNLRKCEQLGILEKVYEPNSWIRANYYRHTATHRLNISALKRRQTYQHFKNNRPLAQPLPPQSVKENPTPVLAQPKCEPPQTAPIALTPQRQAEHRQIGRHTRRDCAKLIALIVQLMRGRTHGEFGWKLAPDDERYRAPMSRDAAIEAACRSFSWTVESAMDAMKFHGYNVATDSDG